MTKNNNQTIHIADYFKEYFKKKDQQWTLEYNTCLINRKEAIIKKKLSEHGFYHLIDVLDKSKFCPILIEEHPDCEKVFVNDGTLDGFLLVTFFPVVSEPYPLNGSPIVFKLKYE